MLCHKRKRAFLQLRFPCCSTPGALFLGQWPAQGLQHLTVLAVYAVGAFWLALALTRKRFRN